MVLEKNPDYWDKDKVYFDRIILKPLPDAQSRFASLQSGEADLIWDDEFDRRQHPEGAEGFRS